MYSQFNGYCQNYHRSKRQFLDKRLSINGLNRLTTFGQAGKILITLSVIAAKSPYCSALFSVGCHVSGARELE